MSATAIAAGHSCIRFGCVFLVSPHLRPDVALRRDAAWRWWNTNGGGRRSTTWWPAIVRGDAAGAPIDGGDCAGAPVDKEISGLFAGAAKQAAEHCAPGNTRFHAAPGPIGPRIEQVARPAAIRAGRRRTIGARTRRHDRETACTGHGLHVKKPCAAGGDMIDRHGAAPTVAAS
ncbi:hypothetical protein ASE95_08790 [Sphingomonas sp. Leaf231]|nr:hypothetical protein ASE95_08790 [Sphingomonas sp. Leaf231]